MNQKRTLTNFEKLFLYGIPLGLIAILILFGFICMKIGIGVKEISAEAIQEFPGDNIEALIAYVNSEKHNLKKRNRAVWALGQLGDARALPVLEKFYTGQPCDHSRYLCQYELKKAIKLCKGGINITQWTWHRFVNNQRLKNIAEVSESQVHPGLPVSIRSKMRMRGLINRA